MNKVKDIECRIYSWILIPVHIVMLVATPIFDVFVVTKVCREKALSFKDTLELWAGATRELLIAQLEIIWKVFTFQKV